MCTATAIRKNFLLSKKLTPKVSPACQMESNPRCRASSDLNDMLMNAHCTADLEACLLAELSEN